MGSTGKQVNMSFKAAYGHGYCFVAHQELNAWVERLGSEAVHYPTGPTNSMCLTWWPKRCHRSEEVDPTCFGAIQWPKTKESIAEKLLGLLKDWTLDFGHVLCATWQIWSPPMQDPMVISNLIVIGILCSAHFLISSTLDADQMAKINPVIPGSHIQVI